MLIESDMLNSITDDEIIKLLPKSSILWILLTFNKIQEQKNQLKIQTNNFVYNTFCVNLKIL